MFLFGVLPMYCMLCTQMESIHLPLERGMIDDISGETDMSAADGSQDTPINSMSTQGAKVVYEREAHIVVDYSSMDDEHKEVCVCVCLSSSPLYTTLCLCWTTYTFAAQDYMRCISIGNPDDNGGIRGNAAIIISASKCNAMSIYS